MKKDDYKFEIGDTVYVPSNIDLDFIISKVIKTYKNGCIDVVNNECASNSWYCCPEDNEVFKDKKACIEFTIKETKDMLRYLEDLLRDEG